MTKVSKGNRIFFKNRGRRRIWLALPAGLLVLWLGGFAAFSIHVLGKQAPAFAAGSGDGEKYARTDAIIVLTGGTNRIKTGLDLFRRGSADYLLITGVDPRVSKADLARLWAGRTDENIGCCVHLDYKALDTLGNARETRKWLADKPDIQDIRLVTSTYHIDRAYLEFSTIMPDIRIVRHAVRPDYLSPAQIRYWLLVFQEYNKLLYSRIRITVPGL